MSGDLSAGGIYVLGSNGTGLTKLVGLDSETRNPEMPVWSPDRRTIAFIYTSYDDPWQIYVVGLDGTPPRRLANSGTSITTQSEPEWSPDGQQIVFSTSNGIATVNADGSGWQTVGSGRLLDPDWLAGGFVASKYTGPGPTSLGGWEHRIVAIEGGRERQVVPNVTTDRKYMDINPDWTR
jgi:Tol biopolymer transport system component